MGGYTMNKLLAIIIVLLLPTAGISQTWSGVLAASRGIDWSQAGSSEINEVRTQCVTTACATVTSAGAASTAAQINAALASALAHTYVLLPAGTYSLNQAIGYRDSVGTQYFQNHTTLRGSGANSTFLVFTAAPNGNGCNGLGGDICVNNTDGDCIGCNGADNTASWTGTNGVAGTYTVGATSATIGAILTGSSTNLRVGNKMVFDQDSDQSDTGNIYVCDQSGTCSWQGGIGCGLNNVTGVGLHRVQQQSVTIDTVTGTGPWTVTFHPGIYAPNWRTSQTPRIWFPTQTPVNGVGIENLSVDVSADTTGSGSSAGAVINFNDAYNGWVKGVRSININSTVADRKNKHVWTYQSYHITVRDSYFFGSQGASESYGVDMGCSSGDDLVENNIFQHISTATIGEDTAGSVIGYNYAVDNYYNNGDPSFQQQDAYHHSAGDDFMLWEGHIGSGWAIDAIHGSAFMETMFRSRISGKDTATTCPADDSGCGTIAKNDSTDPVQNYAFSRYNNAVGNIFGTVGYHTLYEAFPAASGTTGSDRPTLVYAGGWGAWSGQHCSAGLCGTNVPNDTLVQPTFMRWGNWDPVTNGVNFCTSASHPSPCTGDETSSSAATYPGLASPSSTLPASFYYSSKPTAWTHNPTTGYDMPWPPIGPDVTGGNITNTGGHANRNMAAECYLNVMGGSTTGSSGALTFDASTCFAASSSNTTPAPSLGLFAQNHGRI
jgi:hypothetical protein